MSTPEEIEAFRRKAELRFFTASSGQPPTNGQKNSVAVLRQYTIELAAAIDEHVPESRNKSIALTALEDVLMRANRGIFA